MKKCLSTKAAHEKVDAAITRVQTSLEECSYLVTRHATDRCDDNGLDLDLVIDELMSTGELIEFYMWYYYGCKLLFIVNSPQQGIYHVVVTNNEATGDVIITTVYRPNGTFKTDSKTRADASRVL